MTDTKDQVNYDKRVSTVSSVPARQCENTSTERSRHVQNGVM